MHTAASGIVCRICNRLIEPDHALTYVTCVLCRERTALRAGRDRTRTTVSLKIS